MKVLYEGTGDKCSKLIGQCDCCGRVVETDTDHEFTNFQARCKICKKYSIVLVPEFSTRGKEIRQYVKDIEKSKEVFLWRCNTCPATSCYLATVDIASQPRSCTRSGDRAFTVPLGTNWCRVEKPIVLPFTLRRF